MPKAKLFHGSPVVVETPEYGRGRPNNDYGRGFYCTRHAELACEWACREEGADGYVNEYLLDTRGLRTLNLSESDYCALHWLAMLLEHRVFDVKTAVAAEGKRYLLEYFSIDIEPYDVIVGWRADDSYFSFARAFLSNSISYEQLVYAMRLGNLGEQVVLKSKLAFEQIEFVGAEPVASSVYYPKRCARDEKARKDYREESARRGLTGLYLRDIVLEEVRPGDERL